MSPWQAGLEAAAGLDPTGIVPGAIRVGKGLFQTAHAPTGPEDIPAGLNQAFGGLMDAAQIGMIGGAVAAPVRTAASIGAGMLTQEGVQKGLVKMGMPAGWAEFVGNLAGIISGVGTHEAMSPKAVAAIKARVLPVLRDRVMQSTVGSGFSISGDSDTGITNPEWPHERAEQYGPPVPPPEQFTSTGQPLYRPPAAAPPPAPPPAPPVEPGAVTPKPARTRTKKAAPKPAEPAAPEPPPPPVAAQVSEPTPAPLQTFTEFVKEKAAEHGPAVEETKKVRVEEKTGEVVKVEPEAKPAAPVKEEEPERGEPEAPAKPAARVTPQVPAGETKYVLPSFVAKDLPKGKAEKPPKVVPSKGATPEPDAEPAPDTATLGGVRAGDGEGTSEVGRAGGGPEVGGRSDVEGVRGLHQPRPVSGSGGGTDEGDVDVAVTPAVPQPARRPRITDTRPRLTGYRITAADHLGEGSLTDKALQNIEAITTMKLVESEARPATLEEQRKLVKYTGWGALSEVFDYYQSSAAMRAVHADLKNLLSPEEWKTAAATTPNAPCTPRCR